MGLVDIGAILASFIAALGAWAASRSAARASTINASVSGRLEAEQGAYERARTFDVETIERQSREIMELRLSNQALREELESVRARLAHIERLFPEWERFSNERQDEDAPGE